jgi:hypothetical protein
MLSNQLTLDDEDAVQSELKTLQAEAVSQNGLLDILGFLIQFATAPRDRTDATHQFTLCPINRANSPSCRW